jgi:hypothetical protein
VSSAASAPMRSSLARLLKVTSFMEKSSRRQRPSESANSIAEAERTSVRETQDGKSRMLLS